MERYSSRFGEFQVDKENIIVFSQGIPGFSELHRFVILPHAEDSPVHFLQCLDNTEISFAITNPKLFFTDYQVIVEQSELMELRLSSIKEALVFVILVVASNPKNITANLLAPIIINPQNKIGRQVVMTGDKYTTSHRLLAR